MESTTRSTTGETAERFLGETAREVKDQAQAAADRATRYVRDTAQRADDEITKVTGKPLGSWASDVKHWVTSYPLQSALVAVGLGYVLGRLIRRY